MAHLFLCFLTPPTLVQGSFLSLHARALHVLTSHVLSPNELTSSSLLAVAP